MRISLLIPTRNRLEEIERNLRAVFFGSIQPFEVIVSDDSDDEIAPEIERVAKKFSEVKYVRGPRNGLSANRNWLTARSSGDFIVFVDDDAQVDKNYFKNITDCYNKYSQLYGEKIIITGKEIRNGTEVTPCELTFLGHQKKIPQDLKHPKTIVINSTLFPRDLFKQAQFDENLHYGYDEVDIMCQAQILGYNTVFCPEAVNKHNSSFVNRELYAEILERNRIYEMLKIYGIYERKHLKCLVYFIIASLHLFIHNIKFKKFYFLREIAQALKMFFDFKKKYYKAY
ncbi:MAG: glycosyltransferase family 2 protein [Candidatus Omnitrophota bacterium]|nr:MAG: glycosyltransferase family 2 protein [Candidatus Omnitrophota bacterium]